MSSEFYEAKGIFQTNEIRQAYETAVAKNYKYYRAISKSSKVYGWLNGKHFLADKTNAVEINGGLWFVNDKYTEVEVKEPKDKNTDKIKSLEGKNKDFESKNRELENKVSKLEKENNALASELKSVKAELERYISAIKAFKSL